jgi:hypothetical protein
MKQFRDVLRLWPHLLFALIFLAATQARANCSGPAGKEADLTYNPTFHVMQFCNGTSWIAMGQAMANTDVPFVTGEVVGTLRNDYTGNLGIKITVGASNITVSQLGRWVKAGNNASHTLYIFDSTCTSLGSVIVNTSGASAGQFLYGTLSPNVPLSAGAVYYVQSSETSGGDQWYNDDTAITTTAAATDGGGAFSGCSMHTGAPNAYIPVDFKYH